MSKKVLITGASGFIGSFLVEDALSKGLEVYAAIRRTSSKQFLQDPRINFVEVDFSSPEKLQHLLASYIQRKIHFDYVIHNAGITHAKRRGDFHTTNYLYTKNFADALKSSGMEVEKFVLVSSLASFGPGEDTSRRPIFLTDEKKPVSLYGESKVLAEIAVMQSGLPYLVINPTAVYGPRDSGFVQFFKLVSKGIEPYIGRKNQLVSMIYVTDLAHAIISLATSTAANRAFIVSDGKEYYKEELGTISKASLKKKTVTVHFPLPVMRTVAATVDTLHRTFTGTVPFLNSEKLNEISRPNWLCESSDAWNALNDQPRHDLYTGLPKTIEWYKENNWL